MPRVTNPRAHRPRTALFPCGAARRQGEPLPLQTRGSPVLILLGEALAMFAVFALLGALWIVTP